MAVDIEQRRLMQESVQSWSLLEVSGASMPLPTARSP
jgi:hypothetical protein